MHHSTRVPLAGAFGGGGLFGIGYAMGVIDGLREQGIDLSTAPMIGTSAGSWAAAATALGVGYEQLAALDVPRFPNPRSGVLAHSAQRVFGNALRANVRAIACALPRLRRTALDGAKFPLSTIVAASSAVPGLLAPQRIQGRWYIDGGVRSGISVDLATPADLLIVIAPLAGAMFGPFNNLVERNTDREISDWKKPATGRCACLHRVQQLPRSPHCHIICSTKIALLRLTPADAKRLGENKRSGRRFAEKTSAKADQIV